MKKLINYNLYRHDCEHIGAFIIFVVKVDLINEYKLALFENTFNSFGYMIRIYQIC